LGGDIAMVTTHNALHTAVFQTGRPFKEPRVEPSTLQVSFGETNFVKEHDTTKQDKVNKTKTRETVSEGPFVDELLPKVLVGKENLKVVNMLV
jgi:hypothetical protein